MYLLSSKALNLLPTPIQPLHFTPWILKKNKSFDCAPKLISFWIKYIPRSSLTRIIAISLELLKGFEWINNSRISQDILYVKYQSPFLGPNPHLFPATQSPVAQLELQNATESWTSLVSLWLCRLPGCLSPSSRNSSHGLAVRTLKFILNGTRARLPACPWPRVSRTICPYDTSSWPRWLAQLQTIRSRNPDPTSAHLQERRE